MSRASAKSAARSAKTAAGARKKPTKSARKSVKKASASAIRRKSTRPQRAVARKPAAKTAVKTVVAAAATMVRTPAMKAIIAEATMIRTISPPMQPAAPDLPVYPHKYRVGERVYYTSPSFGRAAATGSYTVMKLLPSDGDDHQYRIKSSGEAFERVAKESQLDRV